MNNIFLNSTTLGVVISLLAYYLGVFLKNKTKKAFVNPDEWSAYCKWAKENMENMIREEEK